MAESIINTTVEPDNYDDFAEDNNVQKICKDCEHFCETKHNTGLCLCKNKYHYSIDQCDIYKIRRKNK